MICLIARNKSTWWLALHKQSHTAAASWSVHRDRRCSTQMKLTYSYRGRELGKIEHQHFLCERCSLAVSFKVPGSWWRSSLIWVNWINVCRTLAHPCPWGVMIMVEMKVPPRAPPPTPPPTPAPRYRVWPERHSGLWLSNNVSSACIDTSERWWLRLTVCLLAIPFGSALWCHKGHFNKVQLLIEDVSSKWGESKAPWRPAYGYVWKPPNESDWQRLEISVEFFVFCSITIIMSRQGESQDGKDMRPRWRVSGLFRPRWILTVSHTNRPSAERVDVLLVPFTLDLLLDVPQRKQRQ